MAFNPSEYAYKPVEKVKNPTRPFNYVSGKVVTGGTSYDVYVHNPYYTGAEVNATTYFKKLYATKHKKLKRVVYNEKPCKYTDEPSMLVYWEDDVTWASVVGRFQELSDEQRVVEKAADDVVTTLAVVANSGGTIFAEVRVNGKPRAHYIYYPGKESVIHTSKNGMEEHKLEDKCELPALTRLLNF